MCAPISEPFSTRQLDEADVDLLAFLRRNLLEPNGSRQTRRPAAHDDDVIFHHVAFDAHAAS